MNRFAIGALLLVAAAPVFAELTNHPMIGPAVRSRPAYDGSDTQRGEFVPVIRYFGQPLFVRTTQGVLEGGLRFSLAPGLHAGAQIAYEPGRRSNESGFLESRGVPDVDRGASFGAQLEWDTTAGPAPITVLGRVRRHIESDRGTQADLRVSVGVLKAGALGMGLFAQTTWGDGDAMRSLYGITPAAAATTGLRTYTPDSGLLFGSVGLLWSYDITPQWAAVGNFEVRRLGREAERSPIAQRSTNHSMVAGVAYRF